MSFGSMNTPKNPATNNLSSQEVEVLYLLSEIYYIYPTTLKSKQTNKIKNKQT